MSTRPRSKLVEPFPTHGPTTSKPAGHRRAADQNKFRCPSAEFAGYLNFDYFSANCSFAWNFWSKAQYCWAHLIRDIRFLEKHPDKKTKEWAGQLLARSRRLFSAWHRRDEMTAEVFHRSMLTHRDRFLEVVRKPPSTKEVANLAARFAVVEYLDVDSSQSGRYDLSQHYFRFMFAEGVEPTNNHSEQQIRHCVIDRRITQGPRAKRANATTNACGRRLPPAKSRIATSSTSSSIQ